MPAPVAELHGASGEAVRSVRGPVADEAVKILIERIRRGDLPPNTRLPAQRALAEDLAVSRASLREALSVLETLGYIRVEPSRGTFVSVPESAGARHKWRFAARYSERDIFETRYTLESYTARLASLNATPEDILTLNGFIERMKTAAREKDLVNFANMDFGFHDHIVEISGNQVVGQMLRMLKEAMKETQRLPLSRPSLLWDPIQEHERVLSAIKQHDPEGAAYLMQLHITRAAARARIGLRI